MIEHCGCRRQPAAERLKKWVPPQLDEDNWLRNFAPAAQVLTNIDGTSKSLRQLKVLACDLEQLQQLQDTLRVVNVLVVSEDAAKFTISALHRQQGS